MHPTRTIPAAPSHSLGSHEKYLRGRLRSLGVAETSLDDAVQDVFEVLVRRIAEYDSRFSLRQWMAGVARKVASRHREQVRRAPGTVDEARLPSPNLDPEGWAARQQGLAVLRRFLSGLDDDRWAVFVLSEIEGLRGTEIAAELGVNLNTVYARLRAAKQAFARAVGAPPRAGRMWLFAPSWLFRRPGTAAFTTPLVLVGLGALGLTATLGVRACEARPTEVQAVVSSTAPVVEPSPASPAGIAPRDVDAAALTAPAQTHRGPPEPDAEGWYAGGSGNSESGGAMLSYTLKYRFEGSDLVVHGEYSSDGEAPTHKYGWLVMDGLVLVDGLADWPLVLAAGEQRTYVWRLRAERNGVVRVSLSDGFVPREDASSHDYRFVHTQWQLRHCGAEECAVRVRSIAPYLSGVTNPVELRNDCKRSIEVVLSPAQIEIPPLDAPVHKLAVGERRALIVDSALAFTRRDEEGDLVGTIISDTPGAVIRFAGESCEMLSADAP